MHYDLIGQSREYELLPEAQANLSVALNSSRISLLVCYLFPPPPPAAAEPPPTPAVTPSARTDKGGWKQTIHMGVESGAVEHDRNLSVGFCKY